VLIALGALIGLNVLGRWRLIPAALIVLAAGIGLDATGLDTAYGVSTVGPIELAVHAPGIPHIAADQWLRLGELVFAVVLILYAESYGSIRTTALRHGDRSAPDRDLYALGLANLASGLFQGLPVGAGYSATSANEAAGAQSQRAGWVASAVVLILVLSLLHWIERTPEPVLAAIVIYAVGHTLRLDAFRSYFAWRTDRTIAVVAVGAVLVLGVVDGLLATIALSLATLLRNMGRARVAVLGHLENGHDYVDIERHPEARQTQAVLIVRPESPIFFANADQICATIRTLIGRESTALTVIVSLEESSSIDSSSIEAVGELALWLKQQGRRLLLARVKDGVRDVLGRASLADLPESSYSSWSVDDAVRGAIATSQPFRKYRTGAPPRLT
jgi:MFS superfamily sulfate permease-like transporter